MQIALVKSFTDKPWRSPETYQLIEESLGEKWPVRSTETKDPDELRHFLAELGKKNGQDVFVFNIAEYLDEEDKAGFLPELLAAWRLPYLGSRAEAVAIGLDKGRTKAILEKNGIPTPQFFIAKQADATIEARARDIGYPLIVKPLREGGHIGVSDDSIVYDLAGLRGVVSRVLETYQQPALVEAFVTGEGMREYSVGIIDGETQLAIPMEIDFAAMGMDTDILSYEAAQNDLERIKLVQENAIKDQIVDLATRTFMAVGAQDYCRVDLRADADGCYVLEINVMPGLGRHSFLPEATRDIHGLEHKQLIQTLAEGSIRRQAMGQAINRSRLYGLS